MAASLRTRTIRLAASLSQGDPLRTELLWQVVAAAQLLDVDKLGGSVQYRVDKALSHLGYMVTGGKKPIWVVDVGGALGTVRDLPKEIGEHASGAFTEAAAYAGEAQDWEEEGVLMDMSRKMRRTRFRVEAVVSPRTGKPGYKITW